MKISVLTLGCKTNLSESDLFKAASVQSGHSLVELTEGPDICIINTCSVTSKADYQCRQLLRKAIKYGAKRIIVTGCYAQLNPEALRQIDPEIEIVPLDKKDLIIKELNHKLSSNALKIPRARPFVKIQEGCNFRCSYCIVWKARGASRSRPEEDIISEVRGLEEAGYGEVVLTGTHIGLYGKDFNPKTSLYSLMINLLKNTTKIRFRLSSLEVQEIDDGLIEVLEHERVCRHLHIPLQSGDDRILSLMKRPYRVKDYMGTIERITAMEPDLCIGADIIVGFPGEGEREFRNTLRLVEEIPFSYLHIFPFSPRPGTLASEMPGQVQSVVKKERAFLLRQIDRKKRDIYKRRFLRAVLRCVYEETERDGLSVYRSDNYLKLYSQEAVPGPDGVFLDLRVLRLYRDGLLAEPLMRS